MKPVFNLTFWQNIKTNKWFIIFFFCLFACTFAIAQPIPKVACGSIKRLENFSSKYVIPRNVDIWLPENYNPAKKYNVLYMHDGQALYDSTTMWNKSEWKVDETLCKLLANNQIKDCIVVGIWNTVNKRFQEYFPQKAFY